MKKKHAVQSSKIGLCMCCVVGRQDNSAERLDDVVLFKTSHGT